MRHPLRRSLRLTVCALAFGIVAGCNSNDVLSLKDRAPIPKDALAFMSANGMTKSSPIMMRIFKEEAVLEVWKQRDTGKYALVKSYDICKYSGQKGPKHKEGDRQAPEGYYYVSRHQLNPNSDYHLSFNLGFPNKYDRAWGRTGTHLMVHGDCSSAGCYAMTDENIAEIYAFAREAVLGGQQQAFQVQAYPFRMTAINMARHRDEAHFEYWSMLKEGYDHFELTKQPPKVDVCEKRYIFNRQAEGKFEATAQCPPMEMPEKLALAYNQYQQKYQLEFNAAIAKLTGETAAPIADPIIDPALAPITVPVEETITPVPSQADTFDTADAVVETEPVFVPLPDARPAQ